MRIFDSSWSLLFAIDLDFKRVCVKLVFEWRSVCPDFGIGFGKSAVWFSIIGFIPDEKSFCDF